MCAFKFLSKQHKHHKGSDSPSRTFGDRISIQSIHILFTWLWSPSKILNTFKYSKTSVLFNSVLFIYIHPLLIFHREPGVYPRDYKQGTPWMVYQPFAGHNYTHTTDNLDYNYCLFVVGVETGVLRANPWSTKREHTQRGGRNQTPQPWKCKANMITTVLL